MTDDRNLDAPTPPGGPQRTDAPDGQHTPGEPARDPGPDTARPTGARDVGAAPTETPADQRDPAGDRERADQAENAGTSLDEPSDGSGGE